MRRPDTRDAARLLARVLGVPGGRRLLPGPVRNGAFAALVNRLARSSVPECRAVAEALAAAIEARDDAAALALASGRGVSVREALAAVRVESGVAFAVREGPRRAGDPPILVADTARVRSDLRWSPRHGGLRAIVRSALAWEGARAGGARGQPAAGSV